ncbi:MAG: DUF4251 domain-containing protein [Marinilabiliaceae bacterium]|nr:DUF4251 domain-containing protein [Marinilabiliaceae bacterium]
MERYYFAVVVLVLSILSGSVILSQNKKEIRQKQRIEQFIKTKQIVDSMNFEFVADRALPQGFQPIELTANPNYTRVSDSLVSAYMPFFGRAYSTTGYGEDEGMKFENKPFKDYKIEYNDAKLTIRITFKVEANVDVFRVAFDINYDTSTSMNVTSNNRSSIVYQGELRVLNNDEKNNDK